MDHVWYLAYGSNLHGPRLLRYLERHAAATGTAARPPAADRPARLPHRLFFAHESRVWTGGTAFVDPELAVDADDHSLARAWLLTRAQFESLLAQENGLDRVHVPDETYALRPSATARVHGNRYGLVLGCQSPDHRPALTFTTPASPHPVTNPPTRRYVDTIVAGLVECHRLSPVRARRYLADRSPG